MIEAASDLDLTLASAYADHAATYRCIQQELFAASFDLTDEPSSERAARAVAQFAGLDVAFPHDVPKALVRMAVNV